MIGAEPRPAPGIRKHSHDYLGEAEPFFRLQSWVTSSSSLFTVATDVVVVVVVVVGGVGASISEARHINLNQTMKPVRAALPTVERDGAVRVSERVLGDTSVLGDVRPRDVADVELHVDLVAGVHRHDLVLVVCNTRGEAAAVLQCCSAATHWTAAWRPCC